MRKQSGFLGGSKPFHLEGGHVFLAVCRGAEGGSQFDSLMRIGSDSNRHGGPPESRGSERRVRLPARGITLQVSRVGARSDEVPVEQREEVQHAVQLSRSMEARASAENADHALSRSESWELLREASQALRDDSLLRVPHPIVWPLV